MVKNLPSVERSTKIRFGKHVPDSADQEENTIVFNASNVSIQTPYSDSVYLSPIRNRTDYQAPEIVLLMYDRNTKEITESGESANALIGGSTLDAVANRSNATSNVIQLAGTPTSLVTYGHVGVANFLPEHTLSVGTKFYVDEDGPNTLVVSGNVSVLSDMVVEGNLTVNGETAIIYTENTSIRDAFIELGRNNTSADTTLDLGVLMHRPDALSNVVVGYREGTNEFAIAYTSSAPTDKSFVPNTDEDIDVRVYGRVLTEANVGIINTSPIHTLDVGSNLFVDDLASNILVVRGNVDFLGDLTVTENVYIEEDLLVTGNVYVSTNASVTEELTVSGNVYADKDLEVVGNVYVDGNVVAYKDLLVTGNVYVSTNVVVSRELTVSGNVYADKDLEVLGNAYVSGNVNVTKQLSVYGNAYVSGNVEVTKALIVSANTHLKGDNVFITHTMDFLDPTTAIVTDQVSNVQIRLGQLENVSNTVSNPLINQVLTYDQDNSVWSNAYPDQTIVLVKNTSEAPMTRGQAVHVTGSNGNNMFRVELADASNASKMPAIGIIYEDIPINGEGAAVTFGRANGISGISEFTNGDTLYVSNTVPGGLTNVKPYGVDLDLIQNIGVVVNHSSGVVFVTGIGRANDIPNARIETSNASVNYVYVNSVNNDLRKIDPMKLPTKLQPLTHVVNTGNTAANAVTLRGVSITSGNGFHGDLVVAGNVTVDTTTFHVDAETNRVGLGTTTPKATLHTVGNVFVTSNIVTNSNVIVLGTAATESKTTGALQVVGGVGVQGDIYATNTNFEDVEADSVTVTDATAATNTTTGALKVAGGVGIQGDLHATNGTFTTNVYITNHTDLNNKYLAMIDTNGSLIQSPVYVAPSGKYVISAAEAEFLGNITLGGNTTLLTSTSLIVEDRIIGIGKDNSAEGLDSGIIIEHQDEGTFANIALIHHANEHRFSIGYTQNTLTDNHILNASHPANVTLRIDLIGNAIVQNCLSVADMATFGTKVGIATTEPIANIHVVGNVFVTSNITTSSNIIVTGDAASTSKTTGALQVVGGVGVQGDIYATNANLEDVEARNVNITDTTTSTTTTTGALKVTGGVSTQENLNVGGITKIWDSTVVTGKTDGALVVVGGVGISGDIHATNCNFEDVEADSVNITDTTTSTTTTSGALQVAGGVSTQENLNVGGVTKVWDTTPVTAKTDGALIVAGGVGISGDIHATHCNFEDVEADSVNITDTTASTSKTTGALKVSGGVGVSGALYGAAATFDGVTSVTNATASTSKTTGALKVSGGVGVSGALYGAAATFDGVTSVTNATASTSKTTGALKVTGGVGVSGALYGAAATFDGLSVAADTDITGTIGRAKVGSVGYADYAGFSHIDRGTAGNYALIQSSGGLTILNSTTGQNIEFRENNSIKATISGGKFGIGVTPSAPLHVNGGTIINSDGVAKKTYSYSGNLASGTTIADATITVTFSAHVFYAKIVAHLVESDDEVSTLSLECGGGNWSGGTPLAIAKGPQAIFGSASTNPWNSAVTTTTTTVSFKPTTNMAVAGHYNVFIEYISQSSAGAVSKVTVGSTDVVTFTY